jgi:hypothetical protein
VERGVIGIKMPRKTKTIRKRPQKRKVYSGIDSMEKTLETGIKTAGMVAVTGMTLGFTGAVLGGISK